MEKLTISDTIENYGLRKMKNMKEVVLRDVSLDEVSKIYESLSSERKYIGNPLQMPGRLEFVAGVRVNGEIAGIVWLNRRFAILPFVFHIVKKEFRGRGLSWELTRLVVDYARQRNYSYVLDSVHLDNSVSLAVTAKKGFIKFYRGRKICRQILPLNRRGNFVTKLLLVFGNLPSLARNLVRQPKHTLGSYPDKTIFDGRH